MDKYSQLHSGKLYNSLTAELRREQLERADMVYEFNNTRPSDSERRMELLKKMFRSVGEGSYIEPPFQANWAGKFVSLGRRVYANYNLVLVDDTFITIGDYTQIGPNVTLTTAGHPTDPKQRMEGLQFNKPITIGSNCWLGAGTIVLPGVNIGDNTVVGAGSVVVSDLPENCVAVGTPCKAIKFVSPL